VPYFSVMTREEIEKFVRHVIEHGDGGAGAIRAITEKWTEDVQDNRSDAYQEGVWAGQETAE
jgi:hypothetical protein